MLALYHFGPVANSLTPLLCLLEKGLAFDNRALDSRQWEHHGAGFRAINPEGMVPVLVDGDRAIRESTVINEYLEDVCPDRPLRPSDPRLRAEMRVLTKFVDEYFCPALTVIGAHAAAGFAASLAKEDMARRLADMPNAEVRRKWQRVAASGYSDEELADARRRLGVCLAHTESQLADGRPWLVGADYTLADIKWYSMAAALPRVLPEDCTSERAPLTLAWLSRMADRPAVAALDDYRIKR